MQEVADMRKMSQVPNNENFKPRLTTPRMGHWPRGYKRKKKDWVASPPTG
jgi:hypothetical protein